MSPDSSGSPLLCIGNEDAAAIADSGTGHDTRGGYRLLERVMNYELLVMSGGGNCENY